MGVSNSRLALVATSMSGSTATGGGVLMNCSNRQYVHNYNGGRTAQFNMNIDNPKANFLLTNDCLLKVYRLTKKTPTWQLLMVGDVINVEESGSGDIGTLTVAAADPWWRLQRRLLGMGIDSIGRGTGYTDGTASAMVDNTTLIAHIINALNSVFYTGITLGGLTACGTSGFVGPVYGQNAGDLIQQICNTLGGPSFLLVPQEPSSLMPNTNIATINIAPSIGQTRTNTLFEYGCGKHNVSSYSRVLSKDGLCNQAYSPPQGFPSVSAHGDTMVIGQDTTSQNAIGLYQDLVQGDLSTITLRQVLANEYVTVRKQARQQITFTPQVDNSMDFNVDYAVGDVVPARAFVNGSYRFNGTARIYGVSITEDDNDAETVAVTLIPGG